MFLDLLAVKIASHYESSKNCNGLYEPLGLYKVLLYLSVQSLF